MNPDVLILAVLSGAANWAFRVLPMRARLTGLPPAGGLARLLAATGPAAIGTLFVASVLPAFYPQPKDMIAVASGTAAVLAVFFWRRSVVSATLAGAFAHGLTVWALL